MTKVKNEHYVSQCYLRRFSHNRKIYVFDKAQGKAYQTDIKNVACENGFYDFAEHMIPDNQDCQAVEKALSEIEGDFVDATNKLLQTIDKGSEIEDGLKASLSYHMAIQLLRTPEARKRQTELFERLIRAQAEAILERQNSKLAKYLKTGRIKIRRNADLVPFDHASQLFNRDFIEKIATVLFNHKWLVGVNSSTKPLYTSDTPITTRAFVQDPFFSNRGIGSPGVEIMFPITPRYILCLYERNYHKILEAFPYSQIAIDARSVVYFNSLQVANSRRQVFSPSDDLDIARIYCKEHPEVCDPNRELFDQQEIGDTILFTSKRVSRSQQKSKRQPN